MNSTQAIEQVRRRLTRYDNVHTSDIDVNVKQSPSMATVGFYFESLNDASEDSVPSLDEWRRSSIVVMDGGVVEWTLHLPIVRPPFDADEIEREWEKVHSHSAGLPVIFYVEEYDGVAVPHIDTPRSVWDNEDVDFGVAEFFDVLDSVLQAFSERVYNSRVFGV